jgi:hypothetical protein
MVLKKSPGGSIFPYYYKGGELFGAHYGSFFDNEAALLARMKAEEEFLQNSNRQLPFWADFYESKLTDKVLIEFSQSMNRLQNHITRLAIVGCSSRDKRRLQSLAKQSGFDFPMPVRFFSDPEAAKTWLVGESS